LQPEVVAADAGGAVAEGSDAGKKKPSQQITIDQVRGLDDFLHVGTHRHGARVVLLNPAEAMNRPTANALLKSLEEPIAILCLYWLPVNHHALLPTIRSRCQAVPVRCPPVPLLDAGCSDAGVRDAGDWLALAGGAPLLALELSVSGERVLLDSLLAQVSRGTGLDALAAAANLDKTVRAEKRPAALKRVIDWAQKWLFDLTLASEGLPPRYFCRRGRCCNGWHRRPIPASSWRSTKRRYNTRAQCEQPLNSRLFLEDFFLSYARLFRTS
jgi:DNA polymerase-3 subunit delta'